MGVAWREHKGIVEVTRNKKKGIKLIKIFTPDFKVGCNECVLNHRKNDLCNEFSLCYWASRGGDSGRLPIHFKRLYDNRSKEGK